MPRLFIEHFKKVVEESCEVVERSVISGSATTLEGYKENVGKIKAFRMMLNAIDFELDKYIEDDDD